METDRSRSRQVLLCPRAAAGALVSVHVNFCYMRSIVHVLIAGSGEQFHLLLLGLVILGDSLT